MQLAAAATAKSPLDPVNKTGKHIAIKSYDAVAYFKQGGPVQGSAQHTVAWNGAEWRFASAENKAAFEAKPEAFAPQTAATAQGR